jgi:para-nitrobenzyl esterase
MGKSNQAVVETISGKIEGRHQDRLYVFKGIPYAAPPVGERRWLPPQPVMPPLGVREAMNFGPIAPQAVVPNPVMQRAEQPQSEDCLYLNIWSPGTDNGLRPVLVWIHGGGFNMGSGSEENYAGNTLAARGDVVVVTINYRIGLLGCLISCLFWGVSDFRLFVWCGIGVYLPKSTLRKRKRWSSKSCVGFR